MASSNPHIEQFNGYRVLDPKGFEDRLFSPSSPGYLRYSDAVAFPKAPFVLQSPEEAVARCIALNSHDWESAKRMIAQND